MTIFVYKFGEVLQYRFTLRLIQMGRGEREVRAASPQGEERETQEQNINYSVFQRKIFNYPFCYSFLLNFGGENITFIV
jgi:hypothetical protein